jgi:16S rRNA (adenine1518-N6/adenine1519-N6)-dimethyltransferase
MFTDSQPNKQLGQHWLHDKTILNQIANSANITSQDVILEIGPGLGTLTKELCARAKKVIAVEFDQDLARNLEKNVNNVETRFIASRGSVETQHFASNPKITNLQVINQDILTYDLTKLPAGYKVVANIPYYITGKIVQMLSKAPNPPVLTVLLVQKEVAERLAAKPGSMSLMSINSQLYNEVSLGIEVPAKFFTPPPKVDSQVVIMRRRHAPLFIDLDYPDYKMLFNVARAGFSERRKKLRSSLSAGLHLEKTEIDQILSKSNISPSARAQELTLEQWAELAKTLDNLSN